MKLKIADPASLTNVRGIDSTENLPLATAGLTITQQAGFQITYLRGIGTGGSSLRMGFDY